MNCALCNHPLADHRTALCAGCMLDEDIDEVCMNFAPPPARPPRTAGRQRTPWRVATNEVTNGR